MWLCSYSPSWRWAEATTRRRDHLKSLESSTRDRTNQVQVLTLTLRRSLVWSPQALKAHREMLLKQRNRLNRLVATVERTIESIERGTEMDKKEMFGAFDMSEIEKHQRKCAREAEERWGASEAYQESKRRAAAYGPDDWARIMNRADEIFGRVVDLMDRSPSDPEVQEAVEDWRQHISDSFYTCTPEVLRGLGDLYVSDSRFTATFDRIKSGLARFFSEAISAYCDNLES